MIFAELFLGQSLRPLLLCQLVPTGRSTNFQGQTSPNADLNYLASWFRWLNRPIFKIKHAPEQNSDVIFVEIYMDVCYDRSY
ncbi:hypothetical protein H5410_042216 [Solanum commersonii]|uniref:Secreted protein n=1 Tax=Solanum commersonii TaxID=4109 RepID=A0A9J5XXV7_SOLCO|nr:hypothetical protein H5410_042216 [Solanum commersonii]